MEIETTISFERNGYCVMEQDVILSIDWRVSRDNELTWNVDEYRLTAAKRVWDEMGQKWCYDWIKVAAPESLAKAFDEFLDRKHIEEKLVERLIERRELQPDECSSSLRNDYHARVL